MASDASSSGSGGWGSGTPSGTPGWGQTPQPGQTPQGGWPAPAPSSGWAQQGTQGTQGWGQQPGQPPQSGWGQQPGQTPQGTQAPGQTPQSGWGQQPGQTPQGTQAPGQPPQSGWGQQPGQTPQGTQGWNQPPGQSGWGQPAGWGQSPDQGWGASPGQGSQWAPSLPTSGWDTPEPWADAGYPVDVRYTPEGRIGRFWGIPIIGQIVRGICIIPHAIVLVLLAILVYLSNLVTWIGVLVNGRYPQWAYSLVGGYLRWGIRVQTWVALLSGTYPPFTGADDATQHVRVRIDRDQRINRFWGIPLVGFLVRLVICIPHVLVLMVLGLVAMVLAWFAWVPVLFRGRQADLIYDLYGGYVRYATRVGAYLLLMSGPYPPFRLD